MARKGVLIGVGASLASAGVASAVTWVVANRRLSAQYDEKLAAELQVSVKYILKQMGIETVLVTDDDPDAVADELNSVDEPVEIEIEELDDVAGERVFPSEEEKPPLEDLAARNQATRYDKISTPDVPDDVIEPEVEESEPRVEDPDIFVISRDAFMANASEFEQETITYFSDDGVLDGQGDFIADHETLIGVGKPQFGAESDDANVVYLRNVKLEKEYEIIYDAGRSSDFLVHTLGEMYKPAWARE